MGLVLERETLILIRLSFNQILSRAVARMAAAALSLLLALLWVRLLAAVVVIVRLLSKSRRVNRKNRKVAILLST